MDKQTEKVTHRGGCPTEKPDRAHTSWSHGKITWKNMPNGCDWLFPNTYPGSTYKIHTKRYPGRKRGTLPVKIDEDLKEANWNNNLIVSKFKTTEDLQKLRNIAKGLNGQNFPT